MSKAEGAMEPGFHSETLDPGQAERLVLRFPKADVFVLPLDSDPLGQIHIELEIRGPLEQLQGWKPSVRRREGIVVLADEGQGGVSVREARIRVPAGLRDIEAHSASGSMDIRDLAIDLLASTESGSIRIVGGSAVEVSSSSGAVEVEGAAALTARVGSGSLRCRDIGGYVSAESQSGDVVIESAAGNVVVICASGDVSVIKPGGRLRVVNTSGDVELDISGKFAGGEVTTTTGDVSLVLSGADLELRAETLSGNLDAVGTEVGQTAGPKRCALKLGAGGRRLHIRSVSGDLEIDS